MGRTETKRIGELARRSGTTPRALRHCEQQGPLSSDRDHHGYRLFDTGAVTRARNIRTLLDVGLTAQDVREHLEAGCLDAPSAAMLRQLSWTTMAHGPGTAAFRRSRENLVPTPETPRSSSGEHPCPGS